MRKKIISFLYRNRLFFWILPIFHVLVGKNKFKLGKKNQLETHNANIYKNKFDFSGGINNTVKIGKNADLHNSNIIIKGNNNIVTIGEQSFVNGVTLIIEGDENSVILGNNSFILDNTRIYVVDGSSFIMGNDCMLSDCIEIRATDNHSIIDIKTGKRINPEEPIILHNHVWIGTGVTLLKGTEIANGCIVGAKSVVTKKYLNPNTILVGNPAKETKSNIDWRMERI